MKLGLQRYVCTRILLIIPSLIIVTSIIFLLLHLAPGNPIDIMLAAGRGSREVKEALIRQFGFDKPLHIQYFLWVYNVFCGNLGRSIHGLPVTSLIASKIGYTLELMLISQTLSILLAVAFGALAAYKHNSFLDRFLTLGSLIGYSVPNFWLGLIFILIFSVGLGWFPVFGAFSSGGGLTGFHLLIDHLMHLILPTTVIVIGFTPYYFRLLRASMIEALREDYVTTAKAYGLNELAIIYKYTLKNALIPLTTVIGTSMGLIFGGDYVIEAVFSWPGLGRLLVDAAMGRDYWTVMGVSFITALMVIFSGICIDIAYAFINPRIRFERARD